MKNYNIHLIRHGKTTDNEQGIFAGGGRDTHLSAAGIAELTAMKEKFIYPKVETLFCSPMMRAVQTAQILYPDHKAILVAPLVEAQMGILEGTPHAEIAESGFWQKWRGPQEEFLGDGVEAHSAFLQRTTTAFATLLEGMMRAGIHDAALVTHGGVISVILAQFGLPEREETEWGADNGAGYTVGASVSFWQHTGKVEVQKVQPGGYLKSLGYEEE